MSNNLSPRLTVIVPTWNQKELLRNCLNSLKRQTVSCTVLIVDNGSADSTAEMVRSGFAHFHYLNLGHNHGFAQAVNIGIQRSTTEFIALLNNDAEADRLWVEAGLRAFRKYPDYWFFASRIVNYLYRDRLDSAGDCYNCVGLPYKRGSGEPIQRFSEPQPVLGASAGAAFYRRALFDEIGFFDEDFFIYLEDVDLSLRAQLAGRPCLYFPEAVVNHLEAASDPDRPASGFPNAPSHTGSELAYYSSTRVYWITRNRWQLMIAYQPVRHLPWLIYGWSRSVFFHLFKAGFFAAFLRGLAAGILQTPRALKKRMAMRRKRVISSGHLCQLIRKCSPYASTGMGKRYSLRRWLA